jgi:hypothetical protein
LKLFINIISNSYDVIFHVKFEFSQQRRLAEEKARAEAEEQARREQAEREEEERRRRAELAQKTSILSTT